MNNIRVRKGRPDDAQHYSELVLMSSPALFPTLFGPTVKKMMKNIFRHRRHCFSYDRTYFAEIDGKLVGMAQLHKKKPNLKEKTRLSMLLLKYLKWRLPSKIPRLLRSEQVMWYATGRDAYLSNVAVYPEYRSRGIGTKLFEAIEEEVRNIGKKNIVLKAELHNDGAIKLYQKLGYSIVDRTPTLKLKNKKIDSYVMSKAA
jgi:ribosomal protein S18 acetylase RimI-like enzyme